MSKTVFVHLLPSMFEPAALTGGIAVIADILRASTTITHALANGAKRVIPCGTVDEALDLRQQHAYEQMLLGGERGGMKIDGFDLSNSPDDYDSATVTGKSIGFTTTNGTKALLRSSKAQQSVIGSFVNLSKIVSLLMQQSSSVHVVCAGTNGEITGEDVLFAGAVVSRMIELEPTLTLCDSGRIAFNHWRSEVPDESSSTLETAMNNSQGGRNLIKLGYEKDIRTASSIDSVPIIGIVQEDGILTQQGLCP